MNSRPTLLRATMKNHFRIRRCPRVKHQRQDDEGLEGPPGPSLTSPSAWRLTEGRDQDEQRHHGKILNSSTP